ncbi:helix-turn-helix domain-containing protein [Streptomyces poriticola]|uniref:helix-turn-helix domain-containing protein n=1 Tax=Streptomyces poriticola TaxID=3120506 RepID=UPI002FCE1513
MTSERRRFETTAPELSEELRRLRKLNGLTLAALAKRTNYSKSSWERYLNGKVIPPESAVLAFARTVGVRPEALLVLRDAAESAERASGPAGGGDPDVRDDTAVPDETAAPGGETRRAPREAAPDDRTGEAAAAGPAAGAVATVTSDTAGDAAPGGGDGGGDGRPGPRGAGARPWRKGLLFAGVAGFGAALGLAVGIPLGQERADGDRRTSAVSGCIGSECREKDPQRLNCHIGVWTAAAAQRGDIYLELRYSPGCRAAWARITEAGVGDVARVETEHGVTQERAISYDGDTYSPMVEAPYPAAVRACAELLDGREFCTEDGGASPMREAVTDENERT